jgi:hypothetical protein
MPARTIRGPGRCGCGLSAGNRYSVAATASIDMIARSERACEGVDEVGSDVLIRRSLDVGHKKAGAKRSS